MGSLRFLDGISRNLESNSEHEVIERAVNSMLSSHGQNLEQLKTMTEELTRDEKNLEGKIKKKRLELERCKKRLSSLVNVRPAFMDEYEKLEQELERFYEQYVGRFRNLDYLENELDELNREEKERMEENERALRKMQKKLRDEEWRLLRGEEGAGDKKVTKSGGFAHSKKKGIPRANEPTKVHGGMDAGDEDISSEASMSDSDPPISVGGSHESDDAPVSLGGSLSDDEILNESEEDEEDSGDDGFGGHGRSGMGGLTGGRGLLSNHDF